MSEAYWDQLKTVLGTLSIGIDGNGSITRLVFGSEKMPGQRSTERCYHIRNQLKEYLTGTRTQFNLRLKFSGTTFQRRVWQGLTEIPYGIVLGYGDLARNIGYPGAARAVGQANGANPIPIIIPCHRIVAADGSIGGFSGNLSIKRMLLAIEHVKLAK